MGDCLFPVQAAGATAVNDGERHKVESDVNDRHHRVVVVVVVVLLFVSFLITSGKPKL